MKKPTKREFKAVFQYIGSKGGKASAAAMTPEQRSARAKTAVEARERKRKENEDQANKEES